MKFAFLCLSHYISDEIE